ncbi:hypothetical protein [uncultured Bifidobacterium sp.]|uniref:hypothetical protein n=1 Tax=uncultured Bifidobacterium sp. TaxID=165187 RepID=UPI002601DF0B|nr:hypothetical protein [uncultured Bifidobacterium sp.]
MDSRETASESDEQYDIRVIKDDQGMLIFGDDAAVESWLDATGLRERSRSVTTRALQTGSAGFQFFADAASQGGRWVKLTEESARKVAQYGNNGTGVVRESGKIRGILHFENLSKVSSWANPQLLSGVAGVMTQMALEQSIQEITDYLGVIDSKIDDLLQDQKDQSIANLVGVAHMIDETMMIRSKVGIVTETTWSKISGCPQDLVRAQGFALLKIEGLSQKLSEEGDAVEAERLSIQLNKDITEWLSILGNAVQLQDKLYVLELDRVMAESPETLEAHREGIIEARRTRLHDIESKLFQLNANMRQSAQNVREQKVLHPFAVNHTLQLLDDVNDRIVHFAMSIGIEAERIEIEMAPRWKDAAGKLIVDGANHLGQGAKQVGDGAVRLGQNTERAIGGGVKGAKQLGSDLAVGFDNATKKMTGLFGKNKK